MWIMFFTLYNKKYEYDLRNKKYNSLNYSKRSNLNQLNIYLIIIDSENEI